MKDKLRIMSVVCHMDDMATGIGFTMKKTLDAGHELISVVASCPPDPKEKEIRIKEELRCHSILGISPIFLGYCRQQMLEERVHAFRSDIRRIFVGYSPDVVLAHWPVDVHPSHRAVADAIMDPCFQKGTNVEYFAFEVLSGVGRPQSIGFYPTHYVPIDGESLKIKEQMVFCYESQGPEEIWEAHSELQRERGRECGAENAEAFVRLTRFGEMRRELSDIFQPSTFSLPKGIGIHVDPKKIGLE